MGATRRVWLVHRCGLGISTVDTVDREKMSAMTVRIKELEERLKKHEVMVTRRYE